MRVRSGDPLIKRHAAVLLLPSPRSYCKISDGGAVRNRETGPVAADGLSNFKRKNRSGLPTLVSWGNEIF